MELKFTLLTFINVCQVRWIVIGIPGINYVQVALTGNFSGGVSGNN